MATMRFLKPLQLAFLSFWVLAPFLAVVAKKPHRSSSASSSRSPRQVEASPGPTGSRPRVSQRRKIIREEDEEDDLEFDVPGFDSGAGLLEDEEDEEIFDEEEEEEEEEEEYPRRPKTARSGARISPAASKVSRDATLRSSRPSASRKAQKSRPSSRLRDEEDDDYNPRSRQPPPNRPRPTRSSAQVRPSRPNRRVGPTDRRSGSVVPYTRHQQPSVFSRGLDAIRSSVPDPGALREVASSSINAARATTSSLSTNIYREIKGLTSSELEQVLLKATRPDDSPVKGKHVERLVGVTYQISSRFDIYDAVLRKLWAKMAEKDWRTKVKALYVLHRFSADGAPEHALALKAHLRELRRTRDPKRKDKYFNSKQLLAGEAKPENAKFRAFMSRYAHYVILRAQCFSGLFDEISAEPKADKKKPPKPITNTALRSEHLDAAIILFKAGLACQFKEGEDCENTAIAAERVAADMMGLTAAVAIALNRVLKEEDLKGGDPVLIKRWCELYKKQLLPQTKSMVKKISPKLDAYGLFLPSRIGASVPQDLLERGLSLLEEEDNDDETESERKERKEGNGEEKVAAKKAIKDRENEDEEVQEDDVDEEEEEQPVPTRAKNQRREQREEKIEDTIPEEDIDEDEYEYEDEDEYYDDEEE